jgi:hypothetical protein
LQIGDTVSQSLGVIDDVSGSVGTLDNQNIRRLRGTAERQQGSAEGESGAGKERRS